MYNHEMVVIEKEIGMKNEVDEDFRAFDVIGYEIPQDREYLDRERSFIDPDGITRYRVKMPHQNVHPSRPHVSYLNGLGPYKVTIEKPTISDCVQNISSLEKKLFIGSTLLAGIISQRRELIINRGIVRGTKIMPFIGGAMVGFAGITIRSYCRLSGIIPLEPEAHEFWSEVAPPSLQMIPVERDRKPNFTTRTIRWIMGGAL